MINVTFLSLFIKVVEINFNVSRGDLLLIDVNPKGCGLEEYTTTKAEVNK